MASAPPAGLPLFYKDLLPLSSSAHANFKSRSSDKAPWLSNAHAIPVTVDEFVHAQRYYPIVFSAGEEAVPLALMGLNEGMNVFVDEEGKLLSEAYVPAYVRRYPFMLAKLRPDAEELSLCWDPTSDLVGPDAEGTSLFHDGKTSDTTNNILKFCEEFELSAQRTNAFVKELKEHNLLIDGEVSIQPDSAQQPFIYRGFQMVDEGRFRELRGDTLRKMNQNGMLPLVLAHIMSLTLVRDVFAKQMSQGKLPNPAANLPDAPLA